MADVHTHPDQLVSIWGGWKFGAAGPHGGHDIARQIIIGNGVPSYVQSSRAVYLLVNRPGFGGYKEQNDLRWITLQIEWKQELEATKGTREDAAERAASVMARKYNLLIYKADMLPNGKMSSTAKLLEPR